MLRIASLQAAFGQILRDSIHGGILKSISLLARLLFFILIMPLLAPGELAVYVYINSTALVISIVAIFGLNDELPRVICGEVSKAHAYFRWSILLNILVVVLTLAMIVTPSITLGIVLFAATIIANRFLGGIIRSIDPAGFERLQNLPWILFLIVAIAWRPDNAFDLLIVRAASMCIVIWHSLYLVHRMDGNGAEVVPVSLPDLARRALNHGTTKLISNLSLLGLMRAPLLLPVWMGIEADLDPIAFAVAVGDVIVQFGLIPANRAYAAWCRKPPKRLGDWYHAISFSLVLAAGLAGLSILVLLIVEHVQLMPDQAPGLPFLAEALALYALVSSFYALRYLIWARGVMKYADVVLSGCMFVGCTAIITMAREEYWFAYLAALAGGGFAVLALASRRYFGE